MHMKVYQNACIKSNKVRYFIIFLSNIFYVIRLGLKIMYKLGIKGDEQTMKELQFFIK